MRSKVTVVLLFLNVVLFAYIYWYDLPRIDAMKNLEARRSVLPTEIASMDSLTRTTRTGEVMKLEKRGETWWITKPYEWPANPDAVDRKSTRLNSSHSQNSYAVFCLKKKKEYQASRIPTVD